METCLMETAAVMLQARKANDALVATASAMGKEIAQALEFPDPLIWLDDGKGEAQARIGMPDGGLIEMPMINVSRDKK